MTKFRKNIVIISALVLGALSPVFAMPAQAAQPTIMTTAASAVTQTSATFNGFYSFTGTSIDVRFEYGPTPLLGNTTSYVTKTNPSGTFSATITTEPNKQYFFRAIGITNGQMPAFGSVLSFTTPSYQTPTVMTTTATSVGETTATLNGFFNSNGNTTTTKFQYANNSAFVGTYTTTPVVQSSTSGTFSTPISGLTPNTMYYFRAVATNNGGTVTSTTALSFRTATTPVVYACSNGVDDDGDGLVDMNDPGCSSPTDTNEYNTPPVVYACNNGIDDDGDGLTDYPQDPGCTYATDTSEYNVQTTYACSDSIDNDGDGLVDMNDPGCSSPTDTNEYNTQTTYACNDGIDNDGDGLVDMNDPGCSSATDTNEYNTQTTYACSDSLDNDGDGLVDMNDPGCSFANDTDEYNSSQGSTPTVTTNSASNINQSGATLNGFVNSNGSFAYTWFEYGTTTSLGSATSHIGVGTINSTVTQSISGLSQNTTYYFRLCASNSYGQNCSNTISSFTTTGSGGCTYNCGGGTGMAPTVTTSSAQNTTQTSAYLYGYVDPSTSTPATVWFQYGTSGYGYFSYTAYPSPSSLYYAQNVNAYISNLAPNTTYYYRVCASNSYGQNCGSTLSFVTTLSYQPYIPPTPPVTQSQPQQIIVYQTGGTTVDTSFDEALATLSLTASNRSVLRGDTVMYTLTLRNTGPRTLTNVEMHLSAPNDLVLVSTSDGSLSFQANAISLSLPKLAIDDTKTITVTARVNQNTRQSSFVVHADASYKNTKTGARENTTAEVITEVANNGFLANVFGAGFLPVTFVGWLVLLLIVLIIFLLAHRTYRGMKATPKPAPLPPTRFPL